MRKLRMALLIALVMSMLFGVDVFAKDGPVPDPVTEEQLALGAGVPTPTPISGTTSVAKAARKLINFGECWGWKASTRKSKSVIYVTLTNSKYTWDSIKVAKKKGKVGYWFKGTRYTLGGWKSSLKQYSNSADRKALLKLKAKQSAGNLESYGKKQSWAATRTTKFKSGKAYVYINFTNAKYSYKITVIAARKSDKIAITYLANNQKVSEKYIKETLKKYKATKSKKSNGDTAYGSSGKELPDGMTLLDNAEEVTEDGNNLFGASSLPNDENSTTVVTEEELSTTDEPVAADKSTTDELIDETSTEEIVELTE